MNNRHRSRRPSLFVAAAAGVTLSLVGLTRTARVQEAPGAADPIGFALDGALGGRVLDLATHEARIAALVGNRLWLLEATDEGPKTVAESPPLPGEPQAVAFDERGQVVYVMAGSAGVLVVDAVAAGAPILAVLPRTPPPRSSPICIVGGCDIAVAGETLYALYGNDLVLSDIARPDRPFELSEVRLDGSPRMLAATPWGALAVGGGGNGRELLSIVRADDRRRPVIVGRAGLPMSFAQDLTADAQQAVVAGMPSSVVVDLTDPTAPRVTDVPISPSAVALRPGLGTRVVARFALAERISQIAWLDLTTSPPSTMSSMPIMGDEVEVALLGEGDRAVVSREWDVLIFGSSMRQANRVGEPWPIIGGVDAAAVLDDDHVVTLANDTVYAVRASDGVVVSRVLGKTLWDQLAVAGRWAMAVHNPRNAFEDVTLTAIDLSRPDAPHATVPITLAPGVRVPFGGDGWLGVVTEDAVRVWPVDSAGMGPPLEMRRPVKDARLYRGVLYTGSITEIVAYDLPDARRARPVLTLPAEENVEFAHPLLDVSDRWLVVDIGAVYAYRLGEDHRAIPVPLRLDASPAVAAVIDGDRAFVLLRANSADPHRVVAYDLVSGRRLGSEIVGAFAVDLVAVRLGDGIDGLVVADERRGLLTYRLLDGPPPTPTPLPSATAPATATAAPTPDGKRVYLPFAARTLPSAKESVTFRPVARIGGMARAVRLEGDVAWLSEGRDIVAVDVTAGRDPVELGRAAACEAMRAGCGQLALGGGRLVVIDAGRSLHPGAVRVVDVRDPAHPRPAGLVPLGQRGDGDHYEIAAARPDAARFVLVSDRYGDTEVLVIDATDADRPTVLNIVDRPGRPLRLFGYDGRWVFLGDGGGAEGAAGTSLEVWDVAADGGLTTIGRTALTRAPGVAVKNLFPGIPAALDGPRLLVDRGGGVSMLVVDLSEPHQPRMDAEIPAWTSVDSGGRDAMLGLQRKVDSMAVHGDILAFTVRRVRGAAIARANGRNVDGRWASARIPMAGVPSLSITDDSANFIQRLDVSADRVVVAGGRLGGLSVLSYLHQSEADVTSLPGIGLAHAVGTLPGDPGAVVSSGGAVDLLTRLDIDALRWYAQRSASAVADRNERLSLDVDANPSVDMFVEPAGNGARVWAADARLGTAGFDVGPNEAPAAIPDSLRRTSATGSVGRVAVAADGPILWTVDPQRGLLVWDTSEDGPPRKIWDVGTGGAPEDVALFGSRLVVADGPGGLAVFSRGGLGTPRPIGRLHLPGAAVRVAVDADTATAWVALEERPGILHPLGALGGGRGATAIVAVDLRDPAAPLLLGAAMLDLQHVYDIASGEGRLIVAGALPDPPMAERAFDGRASTAALVAVDADRNAPSVIGRWWSDSFEPGYPSVTILPNGRVAVAAGEDGIRVFEVIP